MMIHNTIKASSLLIALLSSFFSMSQALADSVEEWSYWNAQPQFDPKGFQFVYNSNPTTAEQTRTGTNQGNLVQSTGTTGTAETEWVGFSLANCSGCDSVYSENKLGDIALLPVNQDGTVNDRLLYSDNGPASLLLNLSGEGDANLRLAFQSTGAGSFEVLTPKRESESESGSPRTLFLYILEAYGTSNDPSQAFIAQKSFNVESRGTPYKNIFGDIVIGKLMPVSNIANAVAALPSSNLIYSFIGTSILGSRINIEVNFTQASWEGSFGASRGGPELHNSYQANGTITGNTLTGSVIIPTPMISTLEFTDDLVLGTVVSGQITGRLVGELGNNNIGTAGIIGKSELDVMPSKIAEARSVVAETVPVRVNDIFMLGAPLPITSD